MTEPKIGGLKLAEEFERDIRDNLKEWDADKDSIYYKTDKYGYRFRIEEDVIYCGRFLLRSTQTLGGPTEIRGTPNGWDRAFKRWEAQILSEDCTVGKNWLNLPEQAKKRNKSAKEEIPH